MPQVVAIGEAIVEIMRPDDAAPLDQAGHFLGPFASGAPAIFAVAAARLGLSAGFAGGVGDDKFGRLLEHRLQAENVDCRHLQRIGGYTTGTAFIAYQADGTREFVFHLRHSAAANFSGDQLTADYFVGTSWLHISGSALFLSKKSRQACERALEFTRLFGGKLSLDPNLRPELLSLPKSRQVLDPYIQAADLFLPTVEEAHALTDATDDETAAAALLDGRDRVVVFKRGAAGASIFTQSGRFDSPAFSVEQVDPTGAGDCFNAAFIYGLKSGWSLEQAALFANAAGALAVTRQGPMDGASTVAEAMNLMADST